MSYPYNIEFEHRGTAYSVDAFLVMPGEGTYWPQTWDDMGGFDIEKEPEFTMEFFMLKEDWEPEDSPDEYLVEKAEEMLQDIYWDRFLNGFEGDHHD